MTENRESERTQSLKSKVMKSLLDDGKAKGYLTLDDINSHLSEQNDGAKADNSQMEQIFNALTGAGIEVLEDEDALVGDELVELAVELVQLELLAVEERHLLRIDLHSHLCVAVVRLTGLLRLGRLGNRPRDDDGKEDGRRVIDVREAGDA